MPLNKETKPNLFFHYNPDMGYRKLGHGFDVRILSDSATLVGRFSLTEQLVLTLEPFSSPD